MQEKNSILQRTIQYFILKYKKSVEKLTHFIFTIFNCHLTYKILSLCKQNSGMVMHFIPLLIKCEEQCLPFLGLEFYYFSSKHCNLKGFGPYVGGAQWKVEPKTPAKCLQGKKAKAFWAWIPPPPSPASSVRFKPWVPMWSFRTEQQGCSKVDLELPWDSAISWYHPHTARAPFLCSLRFLSIVRYTGERPCVPLGIYLWPSSRWALRLK